MQLKIFSIYQDFGHHSVELNVDGFLQMEISNICMFYISTPSQEQLRQLDSVAQLVRALHRNRRAAGWIPTRGPIVALFATAPGLV